MRQPGRIITLLLLALGVGALVTACGPDGEASDDQGRRAERRAVTVAAASDLKFALDEIVTAFEKEHPDIDVTVSYGSSGNFYTQLSNRAPFDMFLSADIAFARRLADSGLADAASLFVYGIGQIVVWVPNGSSIDVERGGIAALTDAGVRKVAIANPDHAPYGRAAVAAMRSLGVEAALRERLVLGENIAQTAQFVESGAADAGIVALSLAMAPTMSAKGRYWRVPLDTYPTLEQAGVILSWARDRDATESLRAYITSKGRTILERYGFTMKGV